MLCGCENLAPPKPLFRNSGDSIPFVAVRSATAKLGYSNMEMVSGAGHDSLYIASVAPTSMIFVPCENGISHNEIENAKPEDLEAGCNVLLHAILEVDRQ